MYTKRSYPLSLTLGWTFKFIVVFVGISAIPVLLHQIFGFDFILVPWLPIALIGTALAFYLGFKTNASYDRLWEARKIWGSIVNESRTFGSMAIAYISDKEDARRLVYRHIAFLTALRFQMRDRREWEHNNLREDEKYRKNADIDEFETELRPSILKFISEEEANAVLACKNPSAQLLHLQMVELEALNNAGKIDNFRHAELGNVLRSLYDQEGRTERIKNFPFPRQYASLNFYYVWLFILLLPLGMIGEFEKLGENYVWLNIPFCTIISWVFYTMEMIGDYSENPFEGSFNDVPITSLSKVIEVDLREMLGEKNIPLQAINENHVSF